MWEQTTLTVLYYIGAK